VLRPQVEEPDAARVTNLHVPVFNTDGRVGLMLHVGGFHSLDNNGLAELVADVRNVANRITALDTGDAH